MIVNDVFVNICNLLRIAIKYFTISKHSVTLKIYYYMKYVYREDAMS